MTDDIVNCLRAAADENNTLRDEIERLRERRDDWRAAMTENHDLWRENERLRKVIDALEGEIRETLEMLP